jgi:hypothetical protein
MKLIAGAILGVVAIGSAATFLTTSGKSHSQRARQSAAVVEKGASGDSENDATTRRLATQVAALQLQVAQLNAAAAAAPPSANPPKGEGAEEPEPSLTERRAAEEQKQRARMEAVEEAFRKEVSDQNWAPSARGSVEAALLAENVRLQARSIECRSETCRVELAEEDSRATQARLEDLPQLIGATLPVMQVARTDDASGHHMILYLSRSMPAVQK